MIIGVILIILWLILMSFEVERLEEKERQEEKLRKILKEEEWSDF